MPTNSHPPPPIKSPILAPFYLKINAQSQSAFECLQHWVEIVGSLGMPCIIVCDRLALRMRIYKHIIFPHTRFEMIKSFHSPFKNITKHLGWYWINAADAHLSTFYHAKKRGYEFFWNIDADDTYICATPQRAASMLIKAMIYAREHHLSAFSLDMHASKFKGKLWSFGVSFIANNIDWFALFHQYIEQTKRHQKLPFGSILCIDYIVGYLQEIGVLKSGSFYANNLYFLHFPKLDFVRTPYIGSIYHFKDGILHLPLCRLYHSPLAEIPIVSSSVCIDELEEDKECLMKYVMVDKTNEFRLRKLYGFSTDSKVFEPFEIAYQKALQENTIIA